MRKVVAAILAVPVVGLLYVPVLLRRSLAARIGLAVGVGALVGLAAISAFPARSQAVPNSPIVPVAQSRFTSILQVGHAQNQPVAIDFSQPMDHASVQAALTVAPATPVELAWNADSRSVSVMARGGWAAATYYTVTVGTAARDQAGVALASPVRALFLTQAATQGRLSAGTVVGDRVATTTSFALVFDHPVSVASAKAAFQVQPDAAGSLTADDGGSEAASFTFTPAAPLAADTSYTLSLGEPVEDADGLAVAEVTPLTVRTVAAPTIVRFRPVAGTTGVARDALVSVRFSRAMDEASTAAAFSLTAGSAKVAGSVSWAENDTVLVFDPTALLPYGTKVTAQVATSARSADGAGLATAGSVNFTTLAQPAAPRSAAKPTSSSRGSVVPTGGSTVGGAPWAAVESYYFRLMNCTRTGGWVYSGGTCGSPPTNRAILPPAPALALDATISSRVSRPYAQILASAGVCDHFYGTTPLQRLSAAGYTSGWYGENLGCPSGDPYAGMIAVEIFFQNEPAYPAGLNHYTNIMNKTFHRAGVGVWVVSGRVRVVIDFNP
ncbi:MAG TPA: Ig-like domain-containing protein [Candidatus Limnocylindrales bacterium]